ncbi:MAG: MerC family mercury resistance protein [Proteobacteria bacterium]|jgi:hypothetical protein|nr:MerC family mercury resistance protein [Pseudomonadota bacterium]
MPAPESKPHTHLDRAAMWLSGLCLLHCLALPLAVLLAPTLSNWLEATETTTHWLLFGFAVPISVVALTRGYQRLHNTLTLVLGSAGLLLMLLAVSHIFGAEFEVLLTVIGVSAVLYAHLQNLMGHRASHSKS